MKYTIYQIPNTSEVAYSFMSHSYALNHGFDFNDYEEVYEGELDDRNEECCTLNGALERIFCLFNYSDRRPVDYLGRSISMSDIVKVDGKYFYCDTVGWKKIGED